MWICPFDIVPLHLPAFYGRTNYWCRPMQFLSWANPAGDKTKTILALGESEVVFCQYNSAYLMFQERQYRSSTVMHLECISELMRRHRLAHRPVGIMPKRIIVSIRQLLRIGLL